MVVALYGPYSLLRRLPRTAAGVVVGAGVVGGTAAAGAGVVPADRAGP